MPPKFEEIKQFIALNLQSARSTSLLIEGIPYNRIATVAEVCRQLRQEFLERDVVPILVPDASGISDEVVLPTGVLMIALALACEEIGQSDRASRQLIDEFTGKAVEFHNKSTTDEMETFLEKYFGHHAAVSDISA